MTLIRGVFRGNVKMTVSRDARIKIGIIFIFRFYRRPIQLVVFVVVGLSLFLHLLQVLFGAEVSSVARLGQLTVKIAFIRDVFRGCIKMLK